MSLAWTDCLRSAAEVMRHRFDLQGTKARLNVAQSSHGNREPDECTVETELDQNNEGRRHGDQKYNYREERGERPAGAYDAAAFMAPTISKQYLFNLY